MTDAEKLDSGLRALIDANLLDLGVVGLRVGCDPEEALARLFQLPPLRRSAALPWFDYDHYADQVPKSADLVIDSLAHFLLHGLINNLCPHPLIEPRWIRENHPGALSADATVAEFCEALLAPTINPSPFFDAAHYAAQAGSIGREPWVAHYIRIGAALGHTPHPHFDPVWYAGTYDDVPVAGLETYLHFLRVGDGLGRAPGPGFNPIDYRDNSAGEAPFAAYARGLTRATDSASGPSAAVATVAAPLPPPDHNPLAPYEAVREAIAAPRRQRLHDFVQHDIRPVSCPDPEAALRTLSFPEHDELDLDILIPCYNEFALTVELLASLALHPPRCRYRITVVDDASPDLLLARLAEVPGLNYVRNPQNLHFLRSCNGAFARLSAPALLLLNNDTQVMPGTIDALYDRLHSDAAIGAVGPMVLYPNGRLQEAGCALLPNGESRMIGVGDDPALPEYNRPRDVTYASGCCLMLSRAALDGALFDERFAPAYCEDADLCLRLTSTGHRVVYEPAARVIHHLSATTGQQGITARLQMIYANQAKLVEKWGDLIDREARARVLAFYLPQFHPVAQNDLWWGKGFTEWTNTAKATPAFEGHYQPHLPSDLGYYDLRLTSVMGEQQALATRYGVEGFMVYYYNFSGQRILEQPMESLLRQPEVNFRFALCWANENWTKHWDGGDKAILLGQNYDHATLESVLADALRFARDPRCLTVNGKPIFAIYRPLLIPSVKSWADEIRAAFVAAGFPGVYLLYSESMESIDSGVTPASLGFDACIEFPPQGIGVPAAERGALLKPGWAGHVYDYEASVARACNRPGVAFPRHPGAFPSWDNSARQPMKGTVLHGATPGAFQAYLEDKIDQAINYFTGEERLVFVNAWNEWAEGAHLEPDQRYGHAWLEAVRSALAARDAL